MFEFPYKPPKGYTYEIMPYKRNVLSIWICNHGKFSYTDDTPVKSIWGFYNTKTNRYIAPVNSSTPGEVVEFDATTPYSAMQILKPLRPSVLSFC
jgi:xylose isomerase